MFGLSSDFDQSRFEITSFAIILTWWSASSRGGIWTNTGTKNFLEIFYVSLMLLLVQTVFQGLGITTVHVISCLVAVAGIALTILSYPKQHRFCQNYQPSFEGVCALGRIMLTVSGLYFVLTRVYSYLKCLCDIMIHKLIFNHLCLLIYRQDFI